MRAITAVLLLLAVAGCSPPPDEDETVTYVGTVDGTDAFVGIVVKGDLVVGYVCGGPASVSDLTTWLSRPDYDGSTFSIERGDGKMEGTIAGGRVIGIVTMSGDDHAFAAVEVVPGEPPGLYGAGLESDDCLTGVVVLPDGRVQGASTCGASELEKFLQVTPTAVPDPDGFPVTVPDWSELIVVTPVTRAARY